MHRINCQDTLNKRLVIPLINLNRKSIPAAPPKKKHERRVFTKEEDVRLLELVGKYGLNAWEEIARIMGRKPRQCKERYEQYLSPTQNNGAFTPTEDNALIRAVMQMGRRWSVIQHLFKGRSPVILRNRYNVLVKKNPMIAIVPVPVIVPVENIPEEREPEKIEEQPTIDRIFNSDFEFDADFSDMFLF